MAGIHAQNCKALESVVERARSAVEVGADSFVCFDGFSVEPILESVQLFGGHTRLVRLGFIPLFGDFLFHIAEHLTHSM